MAPEPEPAIAAPTAVADAPDVVIEAPGIYPDLDIEAYHRDPVPGGSLSCSGAKKLLVCPAIFDYERRNPPESTDTFDFGHAAHRVVLGAGADLLVVEADNWRTDAAKAQKAEAHATGRIPLLRKDYAVVQAMAAQLRAHPVANRLLSNGVPEQTLVWRDAETGIMRRALVDLLPPVNPSARMIVVDYKTGESAHPKKFAKAAANYGYDMQDDWYRDGVRTLELDDEPAFLFMVQEKTPPYLVSVVQLDDNARRIGRGHNREAIDIYAACSAADSWPGYTTGVAHVSLPAYYERQNEEYL